LTTGKVVIFLFKTLFLDAEDKELAAYIFECILFI